MRYSKLFTKTFKEAPRDEESKSAQLLIRAGFIYKEMAGVYVMLPLGLRVFNKIVGIIREEMNLAGGQELFMTSLQPKDAWVKSGRWDDKVVDVWFKTRLQNGTDVGLANTHEEAIANMMKEQINSYKDLPIYAYQFQTKMRNELRAKSGIMRTREFIMKDLYSFSRDEKEMNDFYEKMKDAYKKVFERVGLGEFTYQTYASGGSFSKFSHEFQTVTDAGEDTIYLDKKKNIAINEEVYNEEVLEQLGLEKDKLEKTKASEVGNIFPLGTKYSEALGLRYTDENGELRPVVMGSYGIGPARVMGVIAEIFGDENGLAWPESVSPFGVHIVRIGNDDKVVAAADKLYDEIQLSGVEVLYDDRDVSAGQKFADADLIGNPLRVTISPKTLDSNSVEVKLRSEEETRLLEITKVAAFCKSEDKA